MAEDGSRSKRLKAAEDDGVVIAELRRRNAELESSVEQLRGRNAELESEIEQLRRRGQEGNHEVLPVAVVAVATVNLSRIDTSIVAQISSFLGTSRELLNLALTSKSFGWRQTTSALNWSLVEEVARQAVCSAATDAEMSCLHRYVGSVATWLSILHRFELLLVFNVLLGDHIKYGNGDKTTVQCTDNTRSSTAVSSYVMRSGTHYAEFRITREPYIGIVRPMPNLDAGAYAGSHCFFVGDTSLYPAFLAQRSDEWGDGNVHACEYSCGDGDMNWTDWDEEDREGVKWRGMEGCGTGDTVGMLLNLDEGTLTVYKNNRRLGVMKDELSGTYCWYASVAGDRYGGENEAVSIQRGSLPPL